MKVFKYIFLTAVLFLSAAAGGYAGRGLFSPQRVKADDPSSISASAFQVVDREGNVKMIVGSNEDTGQPAIYMFDDKQAARALYTMSKNSEPIIYFKDKAGKVRFAAGVMKDGNPSMELSDAKEKVIWSKP